MDVASEKQASDIVLLDLRPLSTFTDFFVLLTAESRRQLDALREDLAEAMEKSGGELHHVEGTAASGWVLLDFGDIIVHIFGPEERRFYGLDRFWSRAAEVVRIQ